MNICICKHSVNIASIAGANVQNLGNVESDKIVELHPADKFSIFCVSPFSALSSLSPEVCTLGHLYLF